MLETILRVLGVLIGLARLVVAVIQLHKDRRNKKDDRPLAEE